MMVSRSLIKSHQFVQIDEGDRHRLVLGHVTLEYLRGASTFL
jgi:hypothetical protein